MKFSSPYKDLPIFSLIWVDWTTRAVCDVRQDRGLRFLSSKE